MRKLFNYIKKLSMLVISLCISSCLITQDNTYIYRFNPTGNQILISNSQLEGNVRQVFYFSNEKITYNSEACLKAVSGTFPSQEGIALRIIHNGNQTLAIVVMRNVIFSDTRIFNFMLFNSSDKKDPYIGFGHFLNLDGYNKLTKSNYPIYICAAIEGDVIYATAFLSTSEAPWWNTASISGSAYIPPYYQGTTISTSTPGYTGFYIGHIPYNTTTTFSNLDITTNLNVGPTNLATNQSFSQAGPITSYQLTAS